MTTRRLLPPASGPNQTRTVNGRAYTGTPGSVYDVLDFDAKELGANGWIDCGLSGPTSVRPSGSDISVPPLFVGQVFVDATINAVIRWDGSAWRNVVTGASV